MTTPALPARALRVSLVVVGAFTLVSALVGMVGLTLGGGMGLPPEWLDGTVFTSWVVPGVLLGVLVGGTQALALLAQFGRRRVAWGLHAAAGLVLLVWIFVELAILLEWSPLHGVFFAAGALQTALAVLALGAWPTPFLARTPRTAGTDAEA